MSRPVIVFIHPGGFYGFSGQSELFGPNYLLDKDIVLVTINYRLGTLGTFKCIKEMIRTRKACVMNSKARL